MPLYDYKCQDCNGFFEDVIARPDDKTMTCVSCGGILKRQLHCRYGINMGPVPTGGYYDENLGSYIGTNAERKRIMQEQGVTEKGATPKDGDSWV